MDKLPGFKDITVKVKIKADADEKTLQELHLHKHVVSTSDPIETCEDRYELEVW